GYQELLGVLKEWASECENQSFAITIEHQLVKPGYKQAEFIRGHLN
ncbi:hypothetical protein CVH13_00237, partial [Dehalococcoides mccartyi]